MREWEQACRRPDAMWFVSASSALWPACRRACMGNGHAIRRAAFYGTEGQRFESSRARSSTRKILHICRDFVPVAHDASSSLGSL